MCEHDMEAVSKLYRLYSVADAISKRYQVCDIVLISLCEDDIETISNFYCWYRLAKPISTLYNI